MYRSLFCAIAITTWVASLSTLVGCGGSDQDIPLSVQSGQGASENTSTSGAPAPSAGSTATAAASPIPPNHVLVGSWKGSLIATPEQLKAMNCLSVTLELEFGETGEMAMLATMTNAQGTEESSGIASWSIAAQDGNRYTIQSQESEDEISELVIEMVDANTMVVNAAEGGQFKLNRFTPAPPVPQPQSTTPVPGTAGSVAPPPAPAGVQPPPQLPPPGQVQAP